MTVGSTHDNRLRFGWSVSAPHSEFDMIGARPQLSQIAECRGA